MALTDLQNMKPKMNRIMGLRKIDIEDIKPNTNNIYPQDDIEELKQNILEYGLLKPLEVYESDGDYILIGGHRRFSALAELYMDDLIDASINCIIYPKPDDKQDEMLQIISSNAQRPMNDDLRIKITRQLLDVLEHSPEKKPAGMRTREWVSGYLGCSARTAQKYLDIIKNGTEKPKEKIIDTTYDFAESLLRDKFATKVKVNGKKITIAVTGLDDLNRVLKIMGCVDKPIEGGYE